MPVDWSKIQNQLGSHKHVATDVLDPETGEPSAPSGDQFVTQETLDEALAALDFPPDVINNFVTNVAQHDTFVTELTTNDTFITQTVNEITAVTNNNTYINQITQNATFVTNVTNQINGNINAKKGAASELATLDSSSKLTASQIPTVLTKRAVNIIIGDGVSAIAAGTKAAVEIPFAWSGIDSWRVVSVDNTSGSISVDVKKGTYANGPGTIASIAASAKPTLSSAVKNQDTTLTGWTKTGSAGDWLYFIAEATPATVLVI
jgi:hypothetical protein